MLRTSDAKCGNIVDGIEEPKVRSPRDNKKTTFSGGFCIGEPDGIRTHDPLIKSQMLYRLSYEPAHNEWIYRI